jgi:hypothetical protein
MTGSNQLSPDYLTSRLRAGASEEVAERLAQLDEADVDTRKRVLRAIRDEAQQRPDAFDGFAGPLASFVTDDDRAVRLTTAKLFVTLADREPAVVLPVVDTFSERLADDEEFYYVRARCAEALGYVALDSPEAVNDPETLAEFRVGLAFEEPEVRQKLAKALAYVALGNPSRLRHLVSSLTDHLDDDTELVRYHLCTAIVAVGCAYPGKLSDAVDALRDCLDDESPFVQGRAAEALALFARSGRSLTLDDPTSVPEDAPSFLTARVGFLRDALDHDDASGRPDGVGTLDSIRNETERVVEELTSPDGDCPHCGLTLPDGTPPMCPRCGSPVE